MISNNEIPEPPPSFWDSYLSTALNKDVSKLPKSTNIENPISMFLSIPIKRNYQPASGDTNPLNVTLKSLSSLPVGKLMKMGKSDTTSGAGISSTQQKDISGVNLFGKSKDVVPGFLNYKDVLVPWLTKSQQSSGQNYLETQQVSTLDAARIENINILSKYELLMPSDTQWYALNQLRIHAGAPEKSEKGIDKLMEYYAQLLFLESKFPFETEEVQSSFTWYEAFNATRKGGRIYCIY
ncbi:hypothetical protein BKA69DRAFT_787065 [Paraphysoderma sedebokerense]|nr:hypothetical protein BKA69DRAFT_787065 [Paraphysoderma sedebokerense]